jgi:hypothetical protein
MYGGGSERSDRNPIVAVFPDYCALAASGMGATLAHSGVLPGAK